MVDEKVESKTEVPTASSTQGGDKPEGLNKIERAELAVKRMEEAEKRLDEKIARLTELESNRILGSTAGGHIEPAPAKVETPKEYANRIMKNQPIIKDAEN